MSDSESVPPRRPVLTGRLPVHINQLARLPVTQWHTGNAFQPGPVEVGEHVLGSPGPQASP